jgi:hypothetical protein
VVVLEAKEAAEVENWGKEERIVDVAAWATAMLTTRRAAAMYVDALLR